MKKNSCFEQCNRVCEIGPGTGRYLDLILNQIKPEKYGIYEIAEDWALWLEKTYKPYVLRHPADGRSLQNTPNDSCDLVHAHGVFVYLSMLNTFEYFSEMTRVCAPGGFIVFDFFSNKDFTLPVITKWLSFKERYPVVLDEDFIAKYFEYRQFQLIHSFSAIYGHSESRYLIFRKNSSDK